MRDIDNLAAEFSAANFVKGEYKNIVGGGLYK